VRGDDLQLFADDGEHGAVGTRADRELADDARPDLLGIAHRGERRRQPLDALGALARVTLSVPCPQQLALVLLAVPGVEHRRAGGQRAPARVRPQHRVDQNRQPPAIRADDLQRDLTDRSLHPQQRREMGLVVDPAPRGEQVLEAPAAHDVLRTMSRPGQKRLIDFDDAPIGQRREVSERRVLEEVFRALLRHVLVRHAGP
jgi:hypothetical protein